MITPKTSNPLAAGSDFIVLNASAGSGKTYSLVQHILLNALRPAQLHTAYQKILAITFTNNAADEMKARLLKQLLEFTALEKPSKSNTFQKQLMHYQHHVQVTHRPTHTSPIQLLQTDQQHQHHVDGTR